ncbi:hypothetical protein RYX36_000737 [Vicia faba]
MLDLKMAFKVKWQSRWKNCSVVMMLGNDPTIKQLTTKWEAIKIKEIVDKAKTDVLEESDSVTVTFIPHTVYA